MVKQDVGQFIITSRGRAKSNIIGLLILSAEKGIEIHIGKSQFRDKIKK